jgi:four helix bundle protein
MGKSIIKEKSFAFALKIVKLSGLLRDRNEFVLSKQLLRAGTSVGANVREAINAESTADFIHKFSIAQKECDETLYWLELLLDSGLIQKGQFSLLAADAKEILKIIKSIILTSKSKL